MEEVDLSIPLKLVPATTTGGGGGYSGVSMRMSGLLFIAISLRVNYLASPYLSYLISPHLINYPLLLDILSTISYTW